VKAKNVVRRPSRVKNNEFNQLDNEIMELLTSGIKQMSIVARLIRQKRPRNLMRMMKIISIITTIVGCALI